jgi:CDP-diglyceride synthetase
MPLNLADIFAMVPSQILYTIILPFIIAFTIFWGLLTAMRIFGSKVNIVIAFVLAMGLFFTDAYLFIGQFVFATGTFLAAGLFILIFGVGIIIWAVQRTTGVYYSTGDINKLYKRRTQILDKLNRARENEKEGLYRELNLIENKIKEKEHELHM